MWNLLKQHVSRYTPDVVENICGTPKADFLKVCVRCWPLPVPPTEPPRSCTRWLDAAHRWCAEHPYHGDDSAAARQYGYGGRRGKCLARSLQHPGLTDLGLLSTSLPGYLTLPSEKQADLQTYLTANTPKATRAEQVNYWSNYPKFYVSLMKSFYGDAAQKENDWGFEWLPKWDQPTTSSSIST